MTPKGLVVGDSHAGMLVEALQATGPDLVPSAHLEFFVQPGRGPRGFEMQGTRLVPTEPKLVAFLDRIGQPPSPDLTDYDFAVVAGCGLSIYSAVQVARSVAVIGSGKAMWQDLVRANSDLTPRKQQLISQDCYEQVVRDRLDGIFALTLLRTLSDARDIPVFIVPQPRPRTILRGMSGRGVAFAKVLENDDGAMVSGAFEGAVDALCQAITPSHILTQPAETICDDIFTGEQYCEGAYRLSNPGMPQGKRDVLHANVHYGTLVLKQLQEHHQIWDGS